MSKIYIAEKTISYKFKRGKALSIWEAPFLSYLFKGKKLYQVILKNDKEVYLEEIKRNNPQTDSLSDASNESR